MNPHHVQPDNHVPGYKPVLIREEVKSRLQQFRQSADSPFPKEWRIERHMITAALRTVMENPSARQLWLENVRVEVRNNLENLCLSPGVEA